MRIFFSLFVLVFFTFTIFLYNLSNKTIYAYEDRGRVLGVSEGAGNEKIENVKNENKSSFPVNDTKSEEVQDDKPSTPVKIAKSKNIDGVNGAVIDCGSGEMLYDDGDEKSVQIASITKLATNLVFLRYRPDWKRVYKISNRDMVGGGKNYVAIGNELTLRDLFSLSLVASENNATMALVNSTGLKKEEFVKEMNSLADELGLKKTNFNDPIGLSKYNVSVPREIAILAKAAFEQKDIMETVAKHEYNLVVKGRGVRKIESTNELFKSKKKKDIAVLGGKTGFTELAGYCFVGKFTNSDGDEVISVVLGEGTNSARFKNSEALAESVYKSYKWE